MPPADIPALVQRLRRGGSRAALVQAARELTLLLDCEPLAEQQAAFMETGGITVTLRVLQNGTAPVQFEATRLLSHALKHNADACRALAAAGGMEVLVQQLRTSMTNSHDELTGQISATLSMAAAASCPEVRGAIVSAGAVPLVVSLLPRVDSSGQRLVPATLLAVLAKSGPSGRAAVAASGAVETIVQLLRCAHDNAVQYDALTCLGTLADRSPEFGEAAAAAGAIPVVVQLLGSRYHKTQQVAANLLGTLAHACPQLKPSIVEAGGVAALERLLDSSSVDVVQALTNIWAPDGEQEEEEEHSGSGYAPQPAAAAAPSTPAQPARPARPPRVCAAPGCSATRGLKLCAGCMAVRYCSLECSRVHWPAHKAECRRLQAERAAAVNVEE